MLSDAALARLVSSGNNRAFEVIYERYRDDLYRYSLPIPRNAQDAKALQTHERLKGVVRLVRAPKPSRNEVFRNAASLMSFLSSACASSGRIFRKLKPSLSYSEASLSSQASAAPTGAGSLRVLSDTALARLVSSGNTRAFEVIYERYHDDLYRYSLSILRNAQDAEEALQNAMMNAYRALSAGTRDLAVRPWLYRIVHNSAISLIRARPAAAVSLTDIDPAQTGSVAEEVETREELARLRKDIFALPERQRSALVLRELAGLSYIAIAQAIDVPSDDARRLVFEARQSLGEFAAGRELACSEARVTLAGGDGRALRGRKLNAHLRDCEGCTAFYAAQKGLSSKLALIFPALPLLAAQQILAMAGVGATGGAAAAVAGGAAAGGAAVNPAPQIAAGVGLAATVAAVALALVFSGDDSPVQTPPPPPPVAIAASPPPPAPSPPTPPPPASSPPTPPPPAPAPSPSPPPPAPAPTPPPALSPPPPPPVAPPPAPVAAAAAVTPAPPAEPAAAPPPPPPPPPPAEPAAAPPPPPPTAGPAPPPPPSPPPSPPCVDDCDETGAVDAGNHGDRNDDNENDRNGDGNARGDGRRTR